MHSLSHQNPSCLRLRIRRFWAALRPFGVQDAAVTASEYATLLAVLLIVLMVSAMLLGDTVNSVYSGVGGQVAQVNGDDGGGGGDMGGGDGHDGGGDGDDGKGGGGKGHGKGGGDDDD